MQRPPLAHSSALRILGIIFIFLISCAAWMVLGVLMMNRTGDMSGQLRGSVVELWGSPQVQQAPRFSFHWEESREETRRETRHGVETTIRQRVTEWKSRDVSPNASQIQADLKLDQRLKGLMWYSLYNLRFNGTYTLKPELPQAGWLELCFSFPDPGGLYDDFSFQVNQQELARSLKPSEGQVCHRLAMAPGEQAVFQVGYATRGLDSWVYAPGQGVSNIENFKLQLVTDFADIDYPAQTLSPSARLRSDRGWKLEWSFKQLITGQRIGLLMPQRIQPGKLASELAFSAPVSLLFFFLLLFVLATLRGIEVHPINYLFLSGAFFAFHLLFGYSVDHLSLIPAFVTSSLVSIFLVVTYLRLVISPRFAFVEAAGAQLVYLVGFSLAHFWDGFTGLTVTILSILTLFLLMQLTGRVRWGEVLSRKPVEKEG